MNNKTQCHHFLNIFKTGLPFKLFILLGMIILFPIRLASADAPPEIDHIVVGMRSGPYDEMIGEVNPDAFVTVTKDAIPLFTVQADSSGNFQSPYFEINEGDVFVVTSGAGLSPVMVEIPGIFTVQADSSTDEVSGQIQGWLSQTVSVYGDWPLGEQDVLTDGSGNYSATYTDIPFGGSGSVLFHNMVDSVDIYYQQAFRTPDLVLETHYSYDWIQGHYDAGHTINLTVYESDYSTIKATAEVETGVVPQWGAETGFFTGDGDAWVPEAPDIQPGDWVYGLVDNGHDALVRIGDITGNVNSSADSVGGTLDASWLNTGPVNIECYIWEDPGPAEKYDTVIPNGVDTYDCDWSGAWDILPNDHVQVAYIQSNRHIVMRSFYDPAPHLAIQKWFIGNGLPGEGGNAAFYIRYINAGYAPAENVLITDTSSGLSFHGVNTSGLPTLVYSDHVVWQVGTLDPGEWIGFTYTEEILATEGDPISNTVEITTTTSSDMGDPSEKISTWQGTVVANETHLKVWKDALTLYPAPGEDYLYQVNICNDGGTGSSTITLLETLPSAVVFNFWWASDAGWYEMDQTGQTLELQNYSLPPGECHEIFINVTLDEGAAPGDELVNHVEISADNDIEPEDNAADLYHEVGEPFVDAVVWQLWDSGSLVPGGDYRLLIKYRNWGNVLINAPVEITATLPSGVSYNGSDLTPTSMTSNTITWQIGTDLIPGMEGMIALELAIDPDVAPGTTLTNTVDISIPDEDEYPEDDHHELDVYVRDSGLNLQVIKNGDWRAVDVGQVAWWVIRVQNIGDEVIDDIILQDHYPDQMELMGGINANYWGYWEWDDNNPGDNDFLVYFERLEPGQSVDISYRTYVRDDVTALGGMVFTNYVYAPYGGDIEPFNNMCETFIIAPVINTFLPMILK